MFHNTEHFLQEMIEKLSVLNEDTLSKYAFFQDICRFFDISHAFIYESDHAGVFSKKEYYEAVHYHSLPDPLPMQEQLGMALLSELCEKKIVICTGDTKKTPLEERLTELLGLNTLILMPILNQNYELAGFVGLGDRRNQTRHAKAEIDKACALITLLANSVKLEMFQKNIASTEAVLSNVLDHLGIDIYVNDYYTHDVLYANKSMAAPYGGVDNMVGRKCWGSIFPDKTGPCDFCPQPRLLDEHNRPSKTYTWDYERPFDKSWFRVLSSAFKWTDGRMAHLVASVDITENKRSQLMIEKLAQYDYLTGLLNRRSLHDDIQRFTADPSSFGDEWYVLFCDLDDFKTVNDTLGHDAGDVLLRGMADDLQKIATDDIRVYRQGGDEFVVLLRDNDAEPEVRSLIDALFTLFRKRYRYSGQDMGCGCSIGVAHYPSDAATAKELFHLADTAMYRVKKEGRGTVRFCYQGGFLTIDEYFPSPDR